MTKIIVMGAECSGKTQFAGALAAKLDCDIVPEFARLWVQTHKREVAFDDVVKIVEGQRALTSRAITRAKEGRSEFLIFDTCLLQSYIYSEFYFGKVPAVVKSLPDAELLRDLQSATVFVMDPTIPWEADPGQRGAEQARTRIHDEILAQLTRRQVPFTVLSGSVQQRVKAAQFVLSPASTTV